MKENSPASNSDQSPSPMPRAAGPDTNQFRCSACGRYLNTASELSTHEIECRLAKASTEAGRASLQHEDSTPHAPNDAESKEHRFQHGTKQQD